MYPSLAPGDKVICHKTSDIKINDIVAINPRFFFIYNKDPFFHGVLQEEIPIIHRVMEIKEMKGIIHYKTKGDFTWRVDAAFSVVEENEEFYKLNYNESNAYIPEDDILGKVVKIIKKTVACPACSKDFIPERSDTCFDVDIINMLPELGLNFEVKIYKNSIGEKKSRFTKLV